MLTVLALACLPGCEGPSSIEFAIDGAYLGAEAELVLCSGSAIVVDLEFFSAAGSFTDFVIDEHGIGEPDVATSTVLTTDEQRIHQIRIEAIAAGRSVLEVTGLASPEDTVTEWLPITVVECRT